MREHLRQLNIRVDRMQLCRRDSELFLFRLSCNKSSSPAKSCC